MRSETYATPVLPDANCGHITASCLAVLDFVHRVYFSQTMARLLLLFTAIVDTGSGSIRSSFSGSVDSGIIV